MRDLEISLVLVAVNEPLIAGLYENNELKKEFRIFGHTTKALNELFAQICDLQIQNIFYAKGPGRFSSLKATHIFLHTLCIVKDIKLFSTQSFYFNDGAPIHAFAKKYFVKDGSGVQLQDFQNLNSEISESNALKLPQILKTSEFDNQNNPLYILPAV